MKRLLSSATMCLNVSCGINTSMDTRETMLQALSSQPDGYSSVDNSTGEKFKIVSTSANSLRLCRVVSIEHENRFLVETFCKAKGGQWR